MNNLRLLTGLLSVALLSGWTRVYGQSVMTLDEIFAVAETGSTQLRPSFTAVEEAKRGISEAKAARLPDIGVSLSLSYIGDGFITRRDFSDLQKAPIPHLGNGLSVDITQPVYTGGAVTGAIRLAEAKTAAAGRAAELRRAELRMRLAEYYLDIYRNIGLRRVTESNLAAARRVLADMQARHAQGMALRNDITRYELLVSDLELQLLRNANTLAILNDGLVTTAGLPDTTVVIPDTTMLSRVLPQHGEAWWQGEAEAGAPSLGLARSAVDVSRRAEALVRSERRPKIGLKAGWSLDGPILVEVPPLNRNLGYWYVGVGVSYSLSSLYKSGKSLARSRMAVHRATEELDAARDEVSLAVRSGHLRWLEACEELTTRRKDVELAERNYRTMSTRYSAGMALVTDMLDAANARLEAERRLVDARIDIIYRYYRLLYISGKI